MTELANFRALGISELSLEALRRKGFEEPSPIQAKTIPLLISGEKDLIGQAQTGTGKTAAFGLPIIEVLKGGSKFPQALILAPTRELCLQIAEELNSLKGERHLEIAPFYGGQSIEIQLKALKRGVDIAVGTPGRVIDLIERKALNLDRISFAILDEADEMLNMGFVEDIEEILRHTPKEKRMLMFSATMPQPILKIAETFMRPDYEIVHTETERLAVDLTEQIYFEVRREDKLEALSRIIDMGSDLYAMIFCRTRNDVDELTEKLLARGYTVEALHGDIAQAQRTKVINRFKAKKFNLLIATDVAARGIDVNNLTHVINYSIPQGTEAYVHRIGRTGRAGKQGTAITFVTPAEFRQLTRIKREANTEIRRETLPHPNDIVSAKRQRVAEKLAASVAGNEPDHYLSFAEELLTTVDHPAELVAALLHLKYKGELLESAYNDLSVGKRERFSPDERGRTRLFMGVGKRDGYGAADILELVFEKTRIRKNQIGRIDIFDDFSFLNVSFENAELIIDAFHGNGPRVQIAKDDKKGSGNRRGKTDRSFKEEKNPGRERRQNAYPDKKSDSRPRKERERFENSGKSGKGNAGKGKKSFRDEMINFGSDGFGTDRFSKKKKSK